MKYIDKEKFTNKMLYTENERNKNLMDNLQNEINNYKNNINQKEIEIKELSKDKLNLTKNLSDRHSDKRKNNNINNINNFSIKKKG